MVAAACEAAEAEARWGAVPVCAAVVVEAVVPRCGAGLRGHGPSMEADGAAGTESGEVRVATVMADVPTAATGAATGPSNAAFAGATAMYVAAIATDREHTAAGGITAAITSGGADTATSGGRVSRSGTTTATTTAIAIGCGAAQR